MSDTERTIFSRIIAREIPATIVAETDTHTSGCRLRRSDTTVPFPTAVGPEMTVMSPVT